MGRERERNEYIFREKDIFSKKNVSKRTVNWVRIYEYVYNAQKRKLFARATSDCYENDSNPFFS